MRGRFLWAAAVLTLLLSACAADPALDDLVREARIAAAQGTKTLQRPAAADYEGAAWRFGLAYTEEFSPFSLADSPSGADAQVAALLYDRLFVLDETGRPVPALCQTIVREDAVYTLTLGPSRSFSDGGTVTADDAAWSVTAALADGVLPGSRARIVAVEAVDNRTLVITAETPDGGLPAALAAVPILPAGSPREGFVPGSGPYALLEQPDGSLVLTAREAGAGIPVIALTRCDTPEALLLQAQTGGVSLLCTVPTATDALIPHGLFQVREIATPRLCFLIFNTRRAALRDASARRALSAALDRAVLAGTDADPAHTLAPEWAYVAPAASENAPEGSIAPGTALTLLVNTENARKKAAAQAVCGQWQALGLTVTLRVLSWEDYRAALAAGDFDAALAETELPADFAPDALLGTGGALNYGKGGDNAMDALLAAYRQAEGDARRDAMATIQAQVDEICPITPLFFARAAVYSPAGRLTNAAPHWYNLFAKIRDWQFAE